MYKNFRYLCKENKVIIQQSMSNSEKFLCSNVSTNLDGKSHGYWNDIYITMQGNSLNIDQWNCLNIDNRLF